MKTIYAVSSGSYSDYRVDALFSSRKLAEEFMTLIKDNDYNDIEEYQLDPPAADLIKRGYAVWRIHMLKDGTTERVERMVNDKYDVTNIGHAIWERTKASAYKDKGIPDILTSSVWAKTEKQAVKIVNEKRVQMIAAGKFI